MASSGNVVGLAGVPQAKLILKQIKEEFFSNYKFNVCLNRPIEDTEGIVGLEYRVMIPLQGGCGIEIANKLFDFNPGNSNVLGLKLDGSWEKITVVTNIQTPGPDEVGVLFNPNGVFSPLGCFNEVPLVLNFNVSVPYCDIIVCLDGDFLIPKCKVISKCEDFCIHISEIALD